MALTTIVAGEPIRKFGQIIGFAAQEILPGVVHEHNVEMRDSRARLRLAQDARQIHAGTRNARRSRAIAAPTARSARATTSPS